MLIDINGFFKFNLRPARQCGIILFLTAFSQQSKSVILIGDWFWFSKFPEIICNYFRSKSSYARQGGKILSIAACQAHESVACASDNGSIHVVRLVDFDLKVNYWKSNRSNWLGDKFFNEVNFI